MRMEDEVHHSPEHQREKKLLIFDSFEKLLSFDPCGHDQAARNILGVYLKNPKKRMPQWG